MCENDQLEIPQIDVSNHTHLVVCLLLFVDDFIVYRDGVRLMKSYTNATNDLSPKNVHKIMFGRELVNHDNNYCNCAVDEIQIFQMELKEEEVKLLYDSI